MMRKMAEKAGLGPNVKNHSGRKTMIQTLRNNAGYPGDGHNSTIGTQKPGFKV